MKLMKGLILAGGRFKRMNPLAKHFPKSMIHIQGKPILGHVIDGLSSVGISHLVVVIGQGDIFSPIVEYLRSGKFDDSLKIDIVTQKEDGPVGAILSAEKEFSDAKNVFLAHSDIIAPKSFYCHLADTVLRTGADGGCAMTLKSSIKDFGVCILDSTGNVKTVIEHPGEEMDVGNYIGAGAYIFPQAIFKSLKDESNFDQGINSLIDSGYRIAASIFNEENKWQDIGTPYDLLIANKILFSQYTGTQVHTSAKISPNAQLIGPVKVEAGAIIEPGSIIKGPVFIGKNSYIGTNCLIRDNTTIEHDCTIGFSVEIKNTHIQPKSRIGRLSFLGDSVIGQEVIINSGVTVMNHIPDDQPEFIIRGNNFERKFGSVIGDNATIGSNVVLEPKVIINAQQKVPPGVVIENP